VRLDFLYAVATKLQVGHLKRRSVTLVFRKVYQLLLFSLSILYYKKGVLSIGNLHKNIPIFLVKNRGRIIHNLFTIVKRGYKLLRGWIFLGVEIFKNHF
jgi:hypothetical protein